MQKVTTIYDQVEDLEPQEEVGDAGRKEVDFIQEVDEEGAERRDGGKEGLTSHRVGAGHEVEGDGVGGAGRHALHAPLGDLVEAVGGGRHVLVQPV